MANVDCIIKSIELFNWEAAFFEKSIDQQV